MDWIILAKQREEWRAVVSSVMMVKVKKDAWSFLTGGFTGSVRVTLYTMELVIGN
jgi:hypothetical protein